MAIFGMMPTAISMLRGAVNGMYQLHVERHFDLIIS